MNNGIHMLLIKFIDLFTLSHGSNQSQQGCVISSRTYSSQLTSRLENFYHKSTQNFVNCGIAHVVLPLPQLCNRELGSEDIVGIVCEII